MVITWTPSCVMRRRPTATTSSFPKWWNNMCMACEEMQLFYAYLDAVEEAKRKAQPWECQVTVFPQVGDPAAEAPAETAAQPAKPAQRQKSEFSCDAPE